MKWAFRKNPLPDRQAFTLIEVVVALAVLGVITATVLVVVNRAIDTVCLWQTKMEAFDIARENMEKILAQPAVSDLVEYGASEENPDIVWETTVEPCYEPITNNMWIRAVCTAKFLDESGQEQKVELIHWLTSLSKEQIQQILEQQRREEEYYDAMGINPNEQAEQGLRQAQTGNWKDVESWLGPPPEGFKDWGQVPSEQFWNAVMENISKSNE